ISNNNNAAVSVNQNTAYVIINTVLTNCYKSPVLTDMVGTLITTRTSWTGTIDVTLTSGTISRMFDGKTSTYWYVNPAKECNVTVDLSAVTTGITGLRIHSYSTNYSLTSIAVYSSSDGSNWTSQGIATLSTATVYQYIKFYLPIDARYIKLDVKGWKSAYVIMSEFDVYH
ncbi:MAG TPA: discoidin domain-containing protein, partial [Bacteroidales bacterium]